MSYREKAAARGDVPDGPVKLGPPMPCGWCGAITAHETLRTLGARCVPCFRAYCEVVPKSPDSGDKRGGPRGWAWALRSREDAGDSLTPPQKQAWRDALRGLLPNAAEVSQ